MGRYSAVAHQHGPNAPRKPHPVWNGLGCLLIVVVAIMSIAGAIWLVQTGVKAGWPIPGVLLQPIILPNWLYRYAPGLTNLLLKVVTIDYLLAYAAATIVLLVLLGGLVSVVYAYMYQVTGPAKYGPLDAPPDRYRAKRYKR